MSALGVLPRDAVRLLPGSSVQFGPPRRWATWESYRRTTGEGWTEVLPPSQCTYTIPDAPPELGKRLWRDDWPEQGVAILKEARVLGAEGWPVGQRDTLLIDLATGLERPEYTAYLTGRCRLEPRYRGRALNLGSCYARENYCHFLLDALPRLEMFLRSGFTYDDVDWILLPDFFGSSRDPFYDALEIPAAKRVLLQPGAQYAFDLLYQPTFPGRESFVPPWVADFYRERVVKKLDLPQGRELRLYVARSQRGLSNDAELWEALKVRGFQRVEPRTWEENVRLFSSAELVVGPHGAGLSNVIFCPPGARVVELVPGDRPFPYFYSSAAAAGANYCALLVSALAPRGREYRKLPSDAPYPVDVDEVCRVVDQGTGASAQAFGEGPLNGEARVNLFGELAYDASMKPQTRR